MEEYIDIHSHILPGIDDGSDNIEETIHMIEAARNDGISIIIATPHYHEGRYKKKVADYEAALNIVRSYVKDIFPNVRIYLGCEIYYNHECIDLLESNQIPTMAGSKYILLEFSPRREYQYIRTNLQRCLFAGYLPILAHVERYICLEQDISLVEELVNMGVYIQFNTNSIVGNIRGKTKKFVRRLLHHNLVHFMATDAHNMSNRSPVINKSKEYIIKKYGKSYLDRLIIHNPKKVLNNEYI